MKKMSNILVVLIAAVFFALLSGCTEEKGASLTGMNVSQTSQENKPNFITWRSKSGRSLNKVHIKSQYIEQHEGGEIALAIDGGGNEICETVYAVTENYPFQIMKIEVDNAGQPQVVGQLAFKTKDIATHPATGKVYYAGAKKRNGIFPVGVWDPATNTNTVLPAGSIFKPGGKLAFGPDGALYGISRHCSNELYTIDTETGVWTLLRTYSRYLANLGDLAFSPNGILYNLNTRTKKLQIVDLNADVITDIGPIGKNKLSGLAFTNTGEMIFSTRKNYNGEVYKINRKNGKLKNGGGGTGVDRLGGLSFVTLHDQASVRAHLEVLPGSINHSATLTMSMDDEMLMGDVTFGPHGTTFSPDAILNITVTGADLSGVNPYEVKLWYENDETGQWELMETEKVIVDITKGYIRVVNGKLPHFSRYALSKD